MRSVRLHREPQTRTERRHARFHVTVDLSEKDPHIQRLLNTAAKMSDSVPIIRYMEPLRITLDAPIGIERRAEVTRALKALPFVRGVLLDMGPPFRRASAARVASRHIAGAQVFITDMGKPLVTVDSNGKQENIGRYGVWDGRGRRKPEVVATGNDLRKLQREYGPGLPVVRL